QDLRRSIAINSVLRIWAGRKVTRSEGCGKCRATLKIRRREWPVGEKSEDNPDQRDAVRESNNTAPGRARRVPQRRVVGRTLAMRSQRSARICGETIPLPDFRHSTIQSGDVPRRRVMTLSKCYWLRTLGRWLAGASMLMLMFAASTRVQAQSPTPVQGTVALEGTMKKFYRGVNTVIVATMDGVEHVYHFTKDLVVHGGKGTGVDALAGLQEGTTVVLHYTVAGTETAVTEIDRVGDEGLRITEGI